MPDELTTLAAELGIGDLPPEDQQRIIASFGEVVLKSATIAVLGKLSESKREEFGKLAEAGDSAALQAFLDREVPEHEAIAGQAAAEEAGRFKAAVAAPAGAPN